MFAAVRICVPPPDLTRLVVPDAPLAMMPSNCDVPEVRPIVRAAAVALPLSTVPEPVRPAIVGEKPLSRRMAPLATLTAFVPDGLRALALPSCSTPPTITPAASA